jgi:hypothetical protein
MISFLQSNPLLTACGAFCLYPMVVGFLGYYFGKHVAQNGMPKIVWTGRNSSNEVEEL